MQEIFNRRSIRKFKDQEVESQKISQLMQAAMQAPSANNQREWEFLVVDDKQKLLLLSRVSPYAGLLAHAPLAIVVLCNTSKLTSPDFWQQDLGACTQNILLEAVHQDLGACWMGMAPNEQRMRTICAMFNLPPVISPFGIIAVGYPADGQKNQFIDRFDRSVIHNNAW